jgi:hypothetical protein
MKKLFLFLSALFFSFSLFAQWNNLGAGLNGQVSNAVIFQNKLYVSDGRNTYPPLTASGGTSISNGLARWDGSKWEDVPVPISNIASMNITVAGNYLIAVITRYSYTTPLFNGVAYNYSVIKYDGATWTAVENPELMFPNTSNSIQKISWRYASNLNQKALFAKDSVISDFITSSKGLFQFDGINLVPFLPSNCSLGGNSSNYLFTQLGSDIYYFFSMLLKQFFSNNSTCSTLDARSFIELISAYKGEIYAIGSVPNVTTSSYIAKWNPTDYAWYTVGVPKDSIGSSKVRSLTVYNDELYLTGAFKRANQQVVNSIIRWDGTKWNTADAGIYNADGTAGVINFAVEYNGELVVGGQFNRAGTKTANNIARFKTVPTGLQEDKISESSFVITNPSNGQLNIHAASNETIKSLKLIDQLGNTAWQSGVLSVSKYETALSQPAGVYLVEIATDNGKLVRKKLVLQ